MVYFNQLLSKGVLNNVSLVALAMGFFMGDIMENNKNIYMFKLFKEFQSALGEDVPYEAKYLKAFRGWASKSFEIGKVYSRILYSLGYQVTSNHAAEIGKGYFDTITLGYDTALITDFINSLPDKEKSRVIENNVFLNKEKCKYLSKLYGIDTYIMSNPSSIEELNIIKELNNNELSNVVVGVYGYNKCKDKEKKLNMLKEFKKQLNGPLIDITRENDEIYLSMVGTDINKLIRK